MGLNNQVLTGTLYFVGNILNQVRNLAVKHFADPVKMIQIDPLDDLIVHIADC